MATHATTTSDSHGHGTPGASHKHISSIGTYIAVWFVLMILLLATVLAVEIDLDHKVFSGANITLAMAIAFVKMMVVMLWFMHVKDASKLTWIFAGASFIWWGIMIGFTAQDYGTRGYFNGWETPVNESYTPAHVKLTDGAEQRTVGAAGDVPQQRGPHSGTQEK